MSNPARAGESGYWARRVEYARQIRLLSGHVPAARPRKTARELDPMYQPDTTDQARQRELWTADETPGMDELSGLYGGRG